MEVCKSQAAGLEPASAGGVGGLGGVLRAVDVPGRERESGRWSRSGQPHQPKHPPYFKTIAEWILPER
jgi:hypothetical protein